MVLCTVGMLFSYDISCYSYLKYCGIKYTKTIVLGILCCVFFVLCVFCVVCILCCVYFVLCVLCVVCISMKGRCLGLLYWHSLELIVCKTLLVEVAVDSTVVRLYSLLVRSNFNKRLDENGRSNWENGFKSRQ
jgi:hypothetical protein